MSNILQYVSKSAVIDQLTSDLIKEVYQKQEQGAYQNDTEFQYELILAVEKLLAQLNQPSFEFLPAYETPVSSDYNQMIESAVADLKYLLTDCEELTSTLKHTFDESELMRQLFDSELRYINQQLIDMKEKLAKEHSKNQTIFTESFSSQDLVDNQRADQAAHIDQTNGLLMLKPSKAMSFTKEATIEILPESTGIPGNTHMADIIGSRIVFDGSSEPHLDLNAMIDNTLDTWFEYEIFNVSDDVMDQCSHYGFHYKEGLSWVTDDHQLTLKLKINLPTRPTANWISLAPYVSERKGVKAGQIVSCLISDGGSCIQEDRRPRKFDSDLVYIFEPQVIDHIIVEIVQPHAYPVQVGHTYFLKSNQTNSGYYSSGEKELSIRTNGELPSVQNLGISYDPATRVYTQPKSYADNLYLTNIEETKANLFNPPASDETKKTGVELIQANRYSIGIREIQVSFYTFNEESEYVSTDFVTEKPITSLTLESNEILPGAWGEEAADCLQYHISIDQGVNWYPITPIHRAFGKKSRYDINSGDIMRYFSKRSSLNTGVITALADVQQVRLRITLSRPSDVEHQTPIVTEYRLKLTVGEDTLD